MAARPDAGWSWVIAFSCSYIHLALFGIFRSAGVIFVALLDAYDTTREEAAWPFSLCSAIFQLTAPIAGVASHYVSVRKICLLGSFVATVGIACCFFAHNVLWIIIFYGIVHGLGFGLVAALVPVIVNQYFVRYRATGVGIAFSGGTVSTFIFPVAMEFLLHVYGLQGTFLIMGGVVMNTLVASSMLRSPPWLDQKRGKKLLSQRSSCPLGVNELKNDCKTSLPLGPPNSEKLSFVGEEHYVPFNSEPINLRETADKQFSQDLRGNGQVTAESNHSPNHCLKERFVSKVPNSPDNEDFKQASGNREDEPFLQLKAPCHGLNGGHEDLAECGKGTEYSETDRISSGGIHDESDQSAQLNNMINEKIHANKTSVDSSALLPQPTANARNGLENKYIPKDPDGVVPTVPLIEERNEVVIKEKDGSAFKRKPNTVRKRFPFIGEVVAVLCHPMFHILTFSTCFFFLSVHTFFMVVVDFAKDKGIPENHAIYVLSVFSATDLLGRAGLGWVTDRNYIKRKNMVMINLGVIGILNNFYPLATTIEGLFTISAIHGLAVGSSIPLFFVLQAEYLGMKKLPLVIGLMSFINGTTTFFRPAMTGLFRDEIGSYDLMFHFMGVLMLCITAAWLFEPWLRKRSKNFEEEDAMSSRFTDLRKSSC